MMTVEDTSLHSMDTGVVEVPVPPNPEITTKISEETNGKTEETENIGEAKAKIGHSPSGSISSVSSSESTEKLIKSLSMGKLDINKDPDGPAVEPFTVSPIQPTLPTASAPLPRANSTPKPVKFTVRKVSRDTIALPESGAASQSKQRTYAYGNIPENREKAKDRKNSEKVSQLQTNQAKYDQYAARIEKINKEVNFLTNLLPPYNVEIDYVTRTKITKAIEKLRMKQDEIEKKKYSLGISISRLWREHDESEIFVRSVSKH